MTDTPRQATRDEIQSACRAWQSAFDTIEAYNMDMPARPIAVGYVREHLFDAIKLALGGGPT